MLLAAALYPSCPAGAQDFQAKVLRVIAGDIFEIEQGRKTEIVVLYGVAVEGTAVAIAKQAREFAERTVLNQTVTVRIVERRPEMTLVELTLPDGANLGHVMLRNGLLRWDSLSAPNGDGLRDLERLAKQDGRGMWQHISSAAVRGGPGPAQPFASEQIVDHEPAGSGYEIIEGRIITDEKGGRTLVLRGTGQKMYGIEGIVEQQRFAEYEAYLEELRVAEEEQARLEMEAEQRAIEDQRLAEEEYRRQLEFENQMLLNQQLQRNVYFGGVGFTREP
jgi:endonuclease YncB( thermonuclease family)